MEAYSFDFCNKMDLNGQLYGLAAFYGRSPRYLLNESYLGPKS
jgi:hypothetical protein